MTDFGALACSPESTIFLTADFMNIWDSLILVFLVEWELRIVFGRRLSERLFNELRIGTAVASSSHYENFPFRDKI